MKFNVPSKGLYSVAAAVSKVINSKNVVQILDNFLFQLKGDTLTITGSDSDNSLSGRITVTEAEGEGAFCLAARRLVELLKEMPDQGVEVRIDDRTLEVQLVYPSGEYSFIGLPAEQYPEFRAEASDAEPISFTIPADHLITGLDNTLFAVSNDEYRAVMQGVYLDVKPENVTFVATDTRKLVRYCDSRTAPGVEGHCIIPVKPVTVIKSVFAKEESVTFTMTSRSAIVTSGNFTFQCSFINGNFPPYDRVIPRNNSLVLTVDRLALLNAVRRVGVFVESEFNMEKFRITPECILIKATDSSLGTNAREQVPCSFTGSELTMGFSAPFLIEILNTLSGNEIYVNLGDASRPGMFRPAEETEGTELVMLLMPMTVSDF